MNEDVRRSRLRISRRRALSLGGSVGLAGVLAACAGSAGSTGTAPAVTASVSPAASPAEVRALLDAANTCTATAEQTQGPYWFDVDSIRSDLREGRPGTTLALAVRVTDLSACTAGGTATPVPDCVVEIWHCDAGGVYSGFESASTGGGRGGPGGVASGATSDGSYSAGDEEANPTDDGTYLRGAQAADADGIVRFTTVYPGWYRGRTVHIHAKVHVDRATVLTTQFYFDEALTDAVFAAAPYAERGDRDTRNDDDGIFDASGLLTAVPQAEGHLAVINIGLGG